MYFIERMQGMQCGREAPIYLLGGMDTLNVNETESTPKPCLRSGSLGRNVHHATMEPVKDLYAFP